MSKHRSPIVRRAAGVGIILLALGVLAPFAAADDAKRPLRIAVISDPVVRATPLPAMLQEALAVAPPTSTTAPATAPSRVPAVTATAASQVIFVERDEIDRVMR